jgi:general secretion pathway protein D
MLLLAAAGSLAGCQPPTLPPVPTLPMPPANAGVAAPRINGSVGSPEATPPAQFAYGTPQPLQARGAVGGAGGGGGDIVLDFADTDIRDVVAQILGNILRVNYTIDPAVRGTATLHTTVPLTRAQLLPTLQALLGQAGATLVQSGGLFRVITGNAALATANLAGGDAAYGSTLVPLRYAGAEDLAQALRPYVGVSGKIIPAPGANALLVSGDPDVRSTLIALVQAFDINILAGQSYALFPVPAGGAKDFAAALQDAFRSQGGQALAGQIRVVPLERMNVVLVITGQPRYLDEARRVYGLVARAQRQTVRSWHVYFLQNSHADDSAYVLQQAFTPNNVTAQPSATGQGRSQPGISPQAMGGGGQGGLATGGLNSALAGSTITNQNPLAPNATVPAQGGAAAAAAPPPPVQRQTNPLLGGLDGSGTEADTSVVRIIPNPQNNAVLVYATPAEEDAVEAMLRKIDILPLQVRIDATIAEVTLNDQLQYGTQFFFKSGGINGILNTAASSLGNPASTVLNTSFPGFVLSGSGQGGAPIALQALQAVTTVHVLSSPEVLVLDNQPARLQVGDLVPYLTSSSQSTIVSGAPVINSVNYQPTGVILQVTPRVNSGGLVTLDVSQEVSGINTSVTSTTTGIQSPTFTERLITSRVVVQDGQTVGLAGLITDSMTRGNSGIPFLKDIPLLGLLAGNQDNTRQRTELLVLITPHVLHDQADARALTQDLQDELSSAARVPEELQRLPPSGSDDPSRPLRGLIRRPE